MSVDQAYEAYEFAEGLIRGVNDIDELDELSNIEECHKQCPDEFTPEQKELVQRIVLHEYMKAIGKA